MIYTKHYACGTQHQIFSPNACDIGTEKATIFTESQSVGPENSRLQHSRVRFSGTLHKTLFELFETGCFKNTKNHVTPLSFLQIKCLQSKCQQYFLGSTFDFSPVLPKQGRRYVWQERAPSTPTEVSAWKAEEVFLSVSQFLCITRNLWPLIFNAASSSFSKGMHHHQHHHRHNPSYNIFTKLTPPPPSTSQPRRSSRNANLQIDESCTI